jgi:rod shape-determining protein MreD
MSSSVYLAIPLMVILALVETAVLPHFPILGATPQLTFLVALAWGLLYGVEEGAVWAFFAGVFSDFFSITPVGVSSLAFMVGVTAVIFAQQLLPKSRVLLPLVLTALATIVSFILDIVMLRLFGAIADLQSIVVLPTVILINVLAILPVYWLFYFVNHLRRPRRVQL